MAPFLCKERVTEPGPRFYGLNQQVIPPTQAHVLTMSANIR
jgi:hypothetical protein